MDILECLMENQKWEPPYEMELVKYVLGIPLGKVVEQTSSEPVNENPSIQISTNTAYLLNTYFINSTPESVIDGKAVEFVKKIHDQQQDVMIKVTFEAVPRH